MCLHPLLQDLNSFSTEGTTLHYSAKVRSKGINSAYILTYYPVGVDNYNYTVVPLNGSKLLLYDNIKIDIQLPNYSLIRGVWWSTYAMDAKHGIITNIGWLAFAPPPIMRTQWVALTSLSNPTRGVDPGNQVSISSMFYQQLLHARIPKAQKQSSRQSILRFWDLRALKLLRKH